MDSGLSKSSRETFIKKEHLIYILVGIGIVTSVGFALLYLGWSWWVALSLALGGFIIISGYMILHNASTKAIKQQYLTRSFMEIFAMIKVLLLQGKSPYQSLQTVIPYVPEMLQELFHVLMIDLDQDNSIHPYLTFSQNFKSLMIEQLMFAFYQLETQGGGLSSLQQFQYLFDQADQQYMQGVMQTYQERLQSANSQTMIATGLIAFSLLIGIMQLIAGVIYGL
jgi:hypothetical protein